MTDSDRFLSGWVANFAVWLNLLVIFISMGVIAHSPPNYAISGLNSAGCKSDQEEIHVLLEVLETIS